MRVIIGFLVRGRVRIKIRVSVRVGVTFNVNVYHWSKCTFFFWGLKSKFSMKRCIIAMNLSHHTLHVV